MTSIENNDYASPELNVTVCVLLFTPYISFHFVFESVVCVLSVASAMIAPCPQQIW